MITYIEGNDFIYGVKVILNRGNTILEETDASGELIDEYGRVMPTENEVRGDAIFLRFLGVDQHVGKYSFRLWINRGKRNQVKRVIPNAIKLVPYMSQDFTLDNTQNIFICPEFTVEVVQIAMGIKGDKGDQGETPDLTALMSRISAQENLNLAQQGQIDTNTEMNAQQEDRLVNEIGDEATDEDIDALFQ